MNIVVLTPLTEKEYADSDNIMPYAEYVDKFTLAHPNHTAKEFADLTSQDRADEMKDWMVVFIDQRYHDEPPTSEYAKMIAADYVNGAFVVYIDMELIKQNDTNIGAVTLDCEMVAAGVRVEQIVRGSFAVEEDGVIFDGVLYTPEGCAAVAESLLDGTDDSEEAIESARVRSIPWEYEETVRATSAISKIYEAPLPDNIQKDIDSWTVDYYRGVEAVLDEKTKKITEPYGVWKKGTPLSEIAGWAESALSTKITFYNYKENV